MINLISDIIFFFVSLFICLKAIGYGIYEFKENSNKIAGFFIVFFAILSTIFSNIMIKIY